MHNELDTYIWMEICGKVTLLQDPGSQFLAQSLQAFSQPSSLPPVCACVKKNNQSKIARPFFQNWLYKFLFSAVASNMEVIIPLSFAFHVREEDLPDVWEKLPRRAQPWRFSLLSARCNTENSEAYCIDNLNKATQYSLEKRWTTIIKDCWPVEIAALTSNVRMLSLNIRGVTSRLTPGEKLLACWPFGPTLSILASVRQQLVTNVFAVFSRRFW